MAGHCSSSPEPDLALAQRARLGDLGRVAPRRLLGVVPQPRELFDEGGALGGGVLEATRGLGVRRTSFLARALDDMRGVVPGGLRLSARRGELFLARLQLVAHAAAARLERGRGLDGRHVTRAQLGHLGAAGGELLVVCRPERAERFLLLPAQLALGRRHLDAELVDDDADLFLLRLRGGRLERRLLRIDALRHRGLEGGLPLGTRKGVAARRLGLLGGDQGVEEGRPCDEAARRPREEESWPREEEARRPRRNEEGRLREEEGRPTEEARPREEEGRPRGHEEARPKEEEEGRTLAFSEACAAFSRSSSSARPRRAVLSAASSRPFALRSSSSRRPISARRSSSRSCSSAVLADVWRARCWRSCSSRVEGEAGRHR